MLKHLLNKAGVSNDEFGKRMGLKPDEFAEILDGTQRFSQLYKNAFERAALGVALDKRDPNLLDADFKWKVVRLTLLILQECKPNVDDSDSFAADKTAMRLLNKLPLSSL